jgi:hypothetical protein
MSAHPQTGVKGSDCYDSTGDPRVDLSVQLVRGLSTEQIAKGLQAIFAMGTPEAFEDAFVLAFQTRNIRGGKGERQLMQNMLVYLMSQYPPLTQNLLEFVPTYGCWRDLIALAEAYPKAEDSVVSLFVNQLLADSLIVGDKPISLCAKWAPRERNHMHLAKAVAKRMFPEVRELSDRLRQYRKIVSSLNTKIHTTEIKMCSNDWETIEPTQVPARCLQKHRKAFLNENLKSQELRHPHNEVRLACREHFQDFFTRAAKGEVKMHGADTLYPHEVVKTILENQYTEDTYNLLVAQWKAFVDRAKQGGAMRRMKAMCDFSGSMDGLPKLICTALGILVSEVSGSNEILTFDSEPQVHRFDPEATIVEKVQSISDSCLGRGLSTDFQKAMDLVLEEVVRKRMKPEDIPTDLVVFTDMGWDRACDSAHLSYYSGNSYRHVVKTEPWQTHLEMIREAWKRKGEDMWGEPFVPPRIVVWNLRSEYNDFHATSNQEGVVMLSGWSPSLFKMFQEKGIELSTPMSALRAQLDDPLYDPVRVAVRQWRELNSSVV